MAAKHEDTTLVRTMLTGKIHRARVTDADLHYVGSVTIDLDLMRAADILPGQQVDIVDVTNGARLTTYAIAAEAGSGEICINGAAAHLVATGDRSEEHTSELQSRGHLVCRLLLEKKKASSRGRRG